jgi:uncharacterized lipoprotein YmbA
MIFTNCRVSALLGLAVLLAACGSTPSNTYYVLTPREDVAPTGRSPTLGVGPVEIAEYLNRNGLVYHRDGNRLQIAQYERWAEPLQDGVTRVLRLNLAALLNTEDVRPFPWHSEHHPDFAVKVTILALDAHDTRATLEAEWLLLQPDAGKVVRRSISRFDYRTQAEALSPEQLPAAYSDLLYQLSEEIAGAIRTAATGA